jgi:tetratricopeptide (TPR) repeat protein
VGLALLCAPALADDEVILKDGTSIRGLVMDDQGDVVRIAVLRGQDRVVVELPRGLVHWVRRLAEADAQLERDAQEALVKGDLAAAVAGLRQLATARPQDARAQRELGFALLLQGAPEEAARALERACTLDPIDFESHLQLAQALEALGRGDDAITRYRQAAHLGPRHVVAWRSLARLLLGRGAAKDLEEARRALGRAALEAPDQEAIVLEQVDALLPGWQCGAPETAEPGAAAAARALLEQHVGRRPGAVVAGRWLARLLACTGDPSRGRDRALAIAAAPEAAPPMRERARAEASLYGWLAAGLPGAAPPDLDAGEPGCDLEWAGRALELLLDDLPWPAVEGRLLLARARVALREERPDEAGAWLESAALTAPDALPDALLLQEVVASHAREPRSHALFGANVATAKARRAAALAPWLAATHESLARALERDGAFDEAALCWDRAAARSQDPTERARLEAAAAAARDAHARRDRTRGL